MQTNMRWRPGVAGAVLAAGITWLVAVPAEAQHYLNAPLVGAIAEADRDHPVGVVVETPTDMSEGACSVPEEAVNGTVDRVLPLFGLKQFKQWRGFEGGDMVILRLQPLVTLLEVTGGCAGFVEVAVYWWRLATTLHPDTPDWAVPRLPASRPPNITSRTLLFEDGTILVGPADTFEGRVLRAIEDSVRIFGYSFERGRGESR